MKLVIPKLQGSGQLYMTCLRAITGNSAGKAMIDLACCTAPHTSQLGFKHRMYIDIKHHDLDYPDEQQFFRQHDILSTESIPDFHADTMFCLDGIEHLDKHDGLRLRVTMEKYSRRQVIFTPLGKMWLKPGSDHPYDHKSAWYPADFQGWATIVFPDYHKQWGFGAFFAWKCEDIENDFLRAVKEIMQSIEL